MATIILILIGIIALIIIWKFLKPYLIKYDHTYFISGGNGSGKTVTCVKLVIYQLRKARLQWRIDKFKRNIINKYRKHKNKKIEQYNLKHNTTKEFKTYLEPIAKPQIYSNMPLYFKPHFWTTFKNREWACKLEKEHILLYKEIAQNSIVLIDDITQIVNQYNWDLEEVINNVGEFMSLHRQYYNSYVFANSQAFQEIVTQIRRKANIGTWCFNFRTGLFGLYYKMDCCDIMLNDSVGTTMQSQVSENTKTYYGLFSAKGTFESRYLKERVKNILYPLTKETKQARFDKLTCNGYMRMNDYVSPLDDGLTKEEQKKMLNNSLKKQDKKQKDYELEKLKEQLNNATK